MTGTTFYFVDAAQTGRAAKKLVRSHVMKGKNAGKRFHRRSRLQLAPPRLNAGERTIILRRDLDKSQRECHYSDEEHAEIGSIMDYPSNAILTGLPVKITNLSMEIMNEYFARTMNRMYRLHQWLSMDEVQRMWLPLIFANHAAYCCNIALMQTCNEIYSNNGNSSPKALYYLSQTFNYVTRLLAGPDALSDSTIMIVVTLISQELIRKGYGALKVHLDGLQKMIQLRGGLSKLEGNPALLLKVCKVDIMLSLQHGGPPLFFRDRMAKVRNTLALTKLDIDGDAAASCPQHNLLEPYLHAILVDMMGVALLFNNGVQLDLETLQEMILSLGYRLIQFHPSEEERKLWQLQTSYHIGLTIFTMTVFLHAGRRQILDYERVDRRLKEILDTDLEDHNPELALWLSILGGVWASDGYGGHWIPPKIRLMSMRLDIRSWDDVYIVIGHFPWIHALHDDPGHALWDQAHQHE
ncbi:hypothetical protein TARUN_1090 [Trichoderma arundinaceum]|uniref:Uncharacterized protein n=1 Tax=Trichoderma arundinaceum TaxID=490622 RepID=A0A395NYL4_TRIAR|nr:hypothetical protein TARUN_1090 [Trichoderma arundinaceum]